LVIDGRVIPFTAGHAIQNVKRAISQGAQIRDWQINDGTAGSGHMPMPLDPVLEKWFVNDARDAGIDIAFTALHPLVVRGLQAGGVRPPDDRWWFARPPQDCTPWFVFGTPSETVPFEPPTKVIALPTMIPIEPLDSLPPEVRGRYTKLRDRLVFAKRVPLPESPGTVPRSVRPHARPQFGNSSGGS
jgi:hypothetical protein